MKADRDCFLLRRIFIVLAAPYYTVGIGGVRTRVMEVTNRASSTVERCSSAHQINTDSVRCDRCKQYTCAEATCRQIFVKAARTQHCSAITQLCRIAAAA